MKYTIKLILFLLVIQTVQAQNTQKLINNYFVSQLVLSYSIPEMNIFINSDKIKTVYITVNDSINYTLTSNNIANKLMLNSYSDKFFPYFYNDKIPPWQEYYKAKKNFVKSKKEYKISYSTSSILVNNNGFEQKITIIADNEYWIEHNDNKTYHTNYQVKFNNNKLKTIINAFPNQRYIDGKKEYEFANDTIVIEKTYRKTQLASKRIYFFNRNGTVNKVRVFDYETVRFGTDFYGFNYLYDKWFYIYEKHYTYIYDEFGNWIECKEYNEIELVNKIIRKIIYIE